MSETEHIPEGFEKYEPQESMHGTFYSLTGIQKDTLEGLTYSAVEMDRDKDISTLVHEATGIARIAVSTGIVELVHEGNLRPGNKGEPTIVLVRHE